MVSLRSPVRPCSRVVTLHVRRWSTLPQQSPSGESLARRLWPDGSALGRSLRVVEHGRSYTIVGIAPDLFYEELGEATSQSTPQLHLPLGRFGWRGMSFLVRADGSPAELAVPVRDALRAFDPDIAPYEMMTMRERRHFTSWNYRLFGQLFGTFGALAFVLALCGVYGVMAYSVARRRREIGVRVALGAAPTDVRGLAASSLRPLATSAPAYGIAARPVVRVERARSSSRAICVRTRAILSG